MSASLAEAEGAALKGSAVAERCTPLGTYCAEGRASPLGAGSPTEAGPHVSSRLLPARRGCLAGMVGATVEGSSDMDTAVCSPAKLRLSCKNKFHYNVHDRPALLSAEGKHSNFTGIKDASYSPNAELACSEGSGPGPLPASSG